MYFVVSEKKMNYTPRAAQTSLRLRTKIWGHLEIFADAGEVTILCYLSILIK
jgi:hypothetical protein